MATLARIGVRVTAMGGEERLFISFREGLVIDLVGTVPNRWQVPIKYVFLTVNGDHMNLDNYLGDFEALCVEGALGHAKAVLMAPDTTATLLNELWQAQTFREMTTERNKRLHNEVERLQALAEDLQEHLRAARG